MIHELVILFLFLLLQSVVTSHFVNRAHDAVVRMSNLAANSTNFALWHQTRERILLKALQEIERECMTGHDNAVAEKVSIIFDKALKDADNVPFPKMLAPTPLLDREDSNAG